MMSLREILWNVLAFGLFPAWLLAALADWVCHRDTAIELTSGSRESVMHLLLHAEIAVPVLLGLWFEINLGLLVFMAACVLAHMLTALHDTKMALPVRYISPHEQQVHSWMEMLPLFALILVAALHAPAFSAREWRFEWRTQAVPGVWKWWVTLALLAGFALIIEEYVRGRMARRF